MSKKNSKETSKLEIIDISDLIYNPHWCPLKKINCNHADFKKNIDQTTSFKCKVLEVCPKL